jgi:protein PhnA
MSQQALLDRSGGACELCTASENLSTYVLPPGIEEGLDTSVLLCFTCKSQVEKTEDMDVNHWRCLTESMWSEHPPVQVMAWRMLARLNSEVWAQDALEMLYLDDEILNWAKATGEGKAPDISLLHTDSNGVVLAAGDTVVLIKDLPVKGTSMVAKRGTAVRKIGLSPDNSEHIVGKVNGQSIVILTQFVKKS